MEAPPKISVLMSVRNGLPYVRTTVASILNQTFTGFEFVIVDNCSTDGTRDYLQEISKADPRIRLFFNERDLGHSGGLNRGLENCRAPWIARIDADDVALPARLERQLAFVQTRPDLGVTCCQAFYINERGERKGKTALNLFTVEKFSEYMARNEAIGLIHPCVFMRRDRVMAAGGYREPFGGANDIDLWNRLSEQGHLILVQPEYLMEYRIHSAAISSGKFLDSRLKYEWVRACMLARRSGRPEPDWESFQREWNSVTGFQRLNRRRKMLAKMYYRLGGENFITGRRVKGAGYFAFSTLLQPRYALRRFVSQAMARETPAPYHLRAAKETAAIPAADPSPQTCSVAVVIACYNAVAYIRQTLESCRHQTRLPEQIIVVDDASTDGTSLILAEYERNGSIEVLRNEKNLGRDRSFDRALEKVRTKYVAILDADDLALPRRFEQQFAFMEAHPRVGCSSSFVHYINGQGVKIAQGMLDLLTERDFQRSQETSETIGLYCPATIVRTEVFKDPRFRFRADFWPASDIDLWNRIAEAGWQVLAQPEFLTAYRVHSGSAVTQNARKTRFQYDWVRACILARRSGRPEPTRDEFIAAQNLRPWYVRLNQWRKSEAKVAYRAAGFAFGERREWQTLSCLVREF
ncbi:MAG: glycosyltransferase family 2 protein, partial [Verrucomicrobiota bacterium]